VLIYAKKALLHRRLDHCRCAVFVARKWREQPEELLNGNNRAASRSQLQTPAAVMLIAVRARIRSQALDNASVRAIWSKQYVITRALVGRRQGFGAPQNIPLIGRARA
jgi:hypothetical protein